MKKSDMPKDPVLPIWERVQIFLKNVLLSFYPDAYPRFSEKRLLQGFGYLFWCGLLSSAIFAVIFLFMIPSMISSVDKTSSSIDELSIDVNLTVSDPISLYKGNIVIADDSNYTGEAILVTSNSLYLMKPICFSVGPLCFFDSYEQFDWEKFRKPLEHSDSLKKYWFFFALLVLPGLVILYFLISFIYSVIITLVLGFIAFIVSNLFNHKISLSQSLVVMIYALTIFLLAFPFYLLVHNLYYLHLILPVIYGSIGIMLSGHRKRAF